MFINLERWGLSIEVNTSSRMIIVLSVPDDIAKAIQLIYLRAFDDGESFAERLKVGVNVG